ncbi:hypothetical protein [Actinocatenispora rupis]|uniref:hypothetical protein n=1 Tax=Actinocatenispora rupis TaxID=519421 RepID=UPI001941AB10|nr:hypothetical protein [Actinocatenispora rupis]
MPHNVSGSSNGRPAVPGDDGRVVEHGTHDELMAAAGLYADLFTLQATGYTG